MNPPKKSTYPVVVNLKVEKGVLDFQLSTPLRTLGKWLFRLFLTLLLYFVPELWDYLQVLFSVSS